MESFQAFNSVVFYIIIITSITIIIIVNNFVFGDY